MTRVTQFAIVISATMLGACGGGAAAHNFASPTAPSTGPAVSTNTGTAQTFMLRGVVREGSTMNVLSGVRVVIASGPDAGMVAMSGPGGVFTFDNVAAGTFALSLTRDGYLPASDSGVTVSATTYVDEWLFPVPPTDARGAPATARCEDGSWSWARTSADACVPVGIAYPVCPGPLCVDDDHAGRVRF